MTPNPTPPRSVQQIIRYALLFGVLLIGGVVWMLQRSGSLPEPSMDPNRSPVAIVLSVLVLATVASIPLFHRLIRNAGTPQQRFQRTLAGLAVCEGAALLGAVLWILSGAWTMYAVGVGIFVIALIWFDQDGDSTDSE